MSLQISTLYIYPVKSLRPIKITSPSIPVLIAPLGLPYDRLYMLVNEQETTDPETGNKDVKYKNVHAPDLPRGTLVFTSISPVETLAKAAKYAGEGLVGDDKEGDEVPRLTFTFSPPPSDPLYASHANTSFSIPLTPSLDVLNEARKIPVTMHSSAADGWDMGDEVAEWLSERLMGRYRLLYLGQGRRAKEAVEGKMKAEAKATEKGRLGRMPLGTFAPGSAASSSTKSGALRAGLGKLGRRIGDGGSLWDGLFLVVQVVLGMYAVATLVAWTTSQTEILHTKRAALAVNTSSMENMHSNANANTTTRSLLQPLVLLVSNALFIFFLGSNPISRYLNPQPQSQSQTPPTSPLITQEDIFHPRISFADCAQFLVTSHTSVSTLASRLLANMADEAEKNTPLDEEALMLKFRPNIAVSGAEEAFEEDYWSELTITPQVQKVNNNDDDSAVATSQKPWTLALTHNCVRCTSLNIDYTLGEKVAAGAMGKVLKELSRDRRVDKGSKWSPVFGRYGFLGLELGKDEGMQRQGIVVRVGDGVCVSGRSEERSIFDWPNLS